MHAKRFLWLGAYAGCLLPPRGAGGAAACAPGPHREVVVTRPRVVVIHDTRSYGSPDQLCDKTTGRRTDLDFPVTVFGGGGTADHVARHSLVVVGSRIAAGHGHGHCAVDARQDRPHYSFRKGKRPR